MQFDEFRQAVFPALVQKVSANVQTGRKEWGSLKKRGECIKHVSGDDRAQYVSVLCSWLLQTARQTCDNVHYRNLQVSKTDDIPPSKEFTENSASDTTLTKEGELLTSTLSMLRTKYCAAVLSGLYTTKVARVCCPISWPHHHAISRRALPSEPTRALGGALRQMNVRERP